MIPNNYHFVFGLRKQTEPFHLMYYLCLRSCIEINQPDAIFFHYQNEPWGEWWDRIKPNLQLKRIEPDQFISEYKYKDTSLNQYKYAHLADITRLDILLNEGGIYADIDTLFLQPVPKDWFSRQFILGQEKPHVEDKVSLCNAWIASEPNSSLCKYWLENIRLEFDGSWSNHSTLLPYRLAQKHTESINIEPSSSFYELDYTPKGIHNLFVRSVLLPKTSYSLHLWNHLWFDQKRTDFSCFNAKLLTPEYIRFANSTYAKHARNFLPAGMGTSRIKYLKQKIAFLSMYWPWKFKQWLYKLKELICKSKE